ncbi:MAG: hypothetical protein WHS89_12320 [Acidimicrobiales bacterium]
MHCHHLPPSFDPDASGGPAGFRPLAAYRRVLVDRGPRLLCWPLDAVVSTWGQVVDRDDATARWLDAFARRYLHLPPDP